MCFNDARKRHVKRAGRTVRARCGDLLKRQQGQSRAASEPWLRQGLHAGCWRDVEDAGERSGRYRVWQRTRACEGAAIRRPDRAGLGGGPRASQRRVLEQGKSNRRLTGGDPGGLGRPFERGVEGRDPGFTLHRLEGLEEFPDEGFEPPRTKGRQLSPGVAAAGGVLSVGLQAKRVKRVGGPRMSSRWRSTMVRGDFGRASSR